MKKEQLHILVSSICIILTFFLAYFYAYRQLQIEEKKEKKNIYIDIKTTKSSISIQNTPENIFFRINGELLQSGSISLKE